MLLDLREPATNDLFLVISFLGLIFGSFEIVGFLTGSFFICFDVSVEFLTICLADCVAFDLGARISFLALNVTLDTIYLDLF